MSIKYELPPEDTEARKKWAQERDASWKEMAGDSIHSDPEYLRWRRRHWSVFGTVIALAFMGTVWVAIATADRRHPQPRHFAGIFVPACLIAAYAVFLDSAKVRKLALREWTKRRDQELENEKS